MNIWMSPWAWANTLPASSDSIWAISSLRCSTASASLRSIALRSPRDIAAHAGKASLALSTARPTVASSRSGMSAIFRPDPGSCVATVLPAASVTDSPPMNAGMTSRSRNFWTAGNNSTPGATGSATTLMAGLRGWGTGPTVYRKGVGPSGLPPNRNNQDIEASSGCPGSSPSTRHPGHVMTGPVSGKTGYSVALKTATNTSSGGPQASIGRTSPRDS